MNDIMNTKPVKVIPPEVKVFIDAVGQLQVRANVPPLKCIRMLIDAAGAVARQVDEAQDKKQPIVQIVKSNAIPQN